MTSTDTQIKAVIFVSLFFFSIIYITTKFTKPDKVIMSLSNILLTAFLIMMIFVNKVPKWSCNEGTCEVTLSGSHDTKEKCQETCVKTEEPFMFSLPLKQETYDCEHGRCIVNPSSIQGEFSSRQHCVSKCSLRDIEEEEILTRPYVKTAEGTRGGTSSGTASGGGFNLM